MIIKLYYITILYNYGHALQFYLQHYSILPLIMYITKQISCFLLRLFTSQLVTNLVTISTPSIKSYRQLFTITNTTDHYIYQFDIRGHFKLLHQFNNYLTEPHLLLQHVNYISFNYQGINQLSYDSIPLKSTSILILLIKDSISLQ